MKSMICYGFLKPLGLWFIISVSTIWPVTGLSAESFCPEGSHPNPMVVMCVDFEDGSLNVFDLSDETSWKISSDSYSGRFALEMIYRALPRNGDNGGSGFGDLYPVHAPQSLEEFTLRYYEKLSSNWQWSPIATKGWQLRPRVGKWDIYLLNDMWGRGERPTGGHLIDEITQNVSSYDWNSSFGRWVMVEIHIKLNTPRMSNGIFEQWIDGDLVTQRRNVVFRDNDQGVHRFMLSGYWNCREGDCTLMVRPEQRRLIDNIVIAKGNFRIGPTTPSISENP
jgi:hypothetical protein